MHVLPHAVMQLPSIIQTENNLVDALYPLEITKHVIGELQSRVAILY